MLTNLWSPPLNYLYLSLDKNVYTIKNVTIKCKFEMKGHSILSALKKTSVKCTNILHLPTSHLSTHIAPSNGQVYNTYNDNYNLKHPKIKTIFSL